jgi:hypothetical protein
VLWFVPQKSTAKWSLVVVVGLAALLCAAGSRPCAAQATRTEVILLIDISGSMVTIPVAGDEVPFANLKTEIRKFFEDGLPNNATVTLFTFGNDVSPRAGPFRVGSREDSDRLNAFLDGLDIARDKTYLTKGLKRVLEEVAQLRDAPGGRDVNRQIILITDGEKNDPPPLPEGEEAVTFDDVSEVLAAKGLKSDTDFFLWYAHLGNAVQALLNNMAPLAPRAKKIDGLRFGHFEIRPPGISLREQSLVEWTATYPSEEDRDLGNQLRIASAKNCEGLKVVLGPIELEDPENRVPAEGGVTFAAEQPPLPDSDPATRPRVIELEQVEGETGPRRREVELPLTVGDFDLAFEGTLIPPGIYYAKIPVRVDQAMAFPTTPYIRVRFSVPQPVVTPNIRGARELVLQVTPSSRGHAQVTLSPNAALTAAASKLHEDITATMTLDFGERDIPPGVNFGAAAGGRRLAMSAAGRQLTVPGLKLTSPQDITVAAWVTGDYTGDPDTLQGDIRIEPDDPPGYLGLKIEPASLRFRVIIDAQDITLSSRTFAAGLQPDGTFSFEVGVNQDTLPPGFTIPMILDSTEPLPIAGQPVPETLPTFRVEQGDVSRENPSFRISGNWRVLGSGPWRFKVFVTADHDLFRIGARYRPFGIELRRERDEPIPIENSRIDFTAPKLEDHEIRFDASRIPAGKTVTVVLGDPIADQAAGTPSSADANEVPPSTQDENEVPASSAEDAPAEDEAAPAPLDESTAPEEPVTGRLAPPLQVSPKQFTIGPSQETAKLNFTLSEPGDGELAPSPWSYRIAVTCKDAGYRINPGELQVVARPKVLRLIEARFEPLKREDAPATTTDGGRVAGTLVLRFQPEDLAGVSEMGVTLGEPQVRPADAAAPQLRLGSSQATISKDVTEITTEVIFVKEPDAQSATAKWLYQLTVTSDNSLFSFQAATVDFSFEIGGSYRTIIKPSRYLTRSTRNWPFGYLVRMVPGTTEEDYRFTFLLPGQGSGQKGRIVPVLIDGVPSLAVFSADWLEPIDEDVPTGPAQAEFVVEKLDAESNEYKPFLTWHETVIVADARYRYSLQSLDDSGAKEDVDVAGGTAKVRLPVNLLIPAKPDTGHETEDSWTREVEVARVENVDREPQTGVPEADDLRKRWQEDDVERFEEKSFDFDKRPVVGPIRKWDFFGPGNLAFYAPVTTDYLVLPQAGYETDLGEVPEDVRSNLESALTANDIDPQSFLTHRSRVWESGEIYRVRATVPWWIPVVVWLIRVVVVFLVVWNLCWFALWVRARGLLGAAIGQLSSRQLEGARDRATMVPGVLWAPPYPTDYSQIVTGREWKPEGYRSFPLFWRISRRTLHYVYVWCTASRPLIRRSLKSGYDVAKKVTATELLQAAAQRIESPRQIRLHDYDAAEEQVLQVLDLLDIQPFESLRDGVSVKKIKDPYIRQIVPEAYELWKTSRTRKASVFMKEAKDRSGEVDRNVAEATKLLNGKQRRDERVDEANKELEEAEKGLTKARESLENVLKTLKVRP